ncbi:MAG: helix-hairpin-helix domain-containing protein [Burkholderiales bacterium]
MKKTSLLLAALFAAFTLSVQAKDEPKVDAKPAVEKKAEGAEKKAEGTAKAADKKMDATEKKAAAKTKADDKKAAAAKVVDINTATEAEMSALPVIGDAIAKKIVAGRPYKGKDDLVKNKVLTAKEYAKIKNKIIAKQS